jgi:hypothetical protein
MIRNYLSYISLLGGIFEIHRANEYLPIHKISSEVLENMSSPLTRVASIVPHYLLLCLRAT